MMLKTLAKTTKQQTEYKFPLTETKRNIFYSWG